MRTRRSIALLATTGLLALGATSAATAAQDPAKGSGGDARHAKRCERFDRVISALERSTTRLEKRIARVEAKVAAAQLSPEKLARAHAFVAKLKERLAKRQQLTDRLEAKFAEKCPATG